MKIIFPGGFTIEVLIGNDGKKVVSLRTDDDRRMTLTSLEYGQLLTAIKLLKKAGAL